MRPRALERLHIVSKPAFVAYLQHVSATHMGQNIAPVIVMLDKIALGKADAISDVLTAHTDSRNGEIPGLT